MILKDLEELGVKFSKSDTETLNKIYGTLNKKELNELMKGNKKYKVQMNDGKYKELTYKQMTSEQKKSVITRIMSNNASLAKIYMATRKGLRYYTKSEERNQLLKLGARNIFLQTDKKKGFN